MAAITFPANPVDGQEYEFGGSTYTYDATNNRWIANAVGGGSIVVQQARPDPTAASPGDLWWYCGDNGEDPGLYTLIADNSTPPQQQWVQSSPGIAFEGSSGGGGGLSLPTNDEILEQTITTSGTLAAGDFTGTGPAWVVVSGGAGGAAGCGSNGGTGGAGKGGNGGAYAFFLNNITDLVGGVLTAGAGGAGGAFIPGAIDPGVTICNDGANGATTTFVINGTTITCTGGVRGRGSGAGGTDGADGTSSAVGGTPPTELTITELNEDIDAYWIDFVIANSMTGALTIASFLADLDGAQGPLGTFSSTTANVPPGGAGQAGGLYILYQNQ